MADRSADSIGRWLKKNMYRLDGPSQYQGDEPGSLRSGYSSGDALWESRSRVRMCMAASWDYSQAAGNMAVPVVYAAVNDAGPYFLCDRWYLPATQRDMSILEKAGIPAFGIETKRPLREFDVVATSISYTVLLMNFCKTLSMSGIPLRWRDRMDRAGDYPMIMVGGQAYCAPEFMAPVADCVWLGEVEDEEGNPGGIGEVFGVIESMKAAGLWSSDREGCYARLARQFSHLYFPRFTGFTYRYEDRGLPEPVKMVSGAYPWLDGMAFPHRARQVRDLDKTRPLTSAPLLYSDPGMGAGDIEIAKGCIAWSVPQDSLVEVAGRGSVTFSTVRPGERIRVGQGYHEVSGVALHGEKYTVSVQTRQGHELECTPEHEVLVVRGPVPSGLRSRRAWLDAAPRVWVHAEDLQPGDRLLRTVGGVDWSSENVPVRFAELDYRVGRGRVLRQYSSLFPEEVTPEVGWFLGMVTGDCYVRRSQLEFRLESRAAEWRARLHSVVKDLFDVDLTEYPAPDGNSVHLNLNSARVVRWLASNFGIRDSASRKIVPEAIFRSPRAVVAAYLSALYDCNGTSLIPKSDTSSVTIRFAVHAEQQIRGVAELLRLLGLPSAVRSEVTSVARNGAPAVRPSRLWECRTMASDREESYDWLESLEPFKSRHLGQFRPPAERAAAQGGLHYLEVTGVVPCRVTSVMDVEVPGPQAFNVLGVYVHNCGFCRLSWVTKPYRQHTVEYLLRQAKVWRLAMGCADISLVAPDPPVYTQLKALITGLMEQVTSEVDASSMRVDDFTSDPDLSLLLSMAGAQSVTLGAEGGSQRIRDLAGKGTSDDDLAKAVMAAIRVGIKRIKIYFISNWPGEQPADVMRVVELARRLADIRESFGTAGKGVRIIFSWTPLLIEAQTPLQWFPATAPDYTLQKALDMLRDLHVDMHIGTKANPAKMAFFQACQRASRDAGEAIVDVIESVGTASWGGFPADMKEQLDAALVARGFLNGLDDLFGERFEHDLFGWEHISTGVAKSLMWRVYQSMVRFLENTDPDTYDEHCGGDYHGQEFVQRCDQGCQGNSCGACDRQDLELRRDYIEAGKSDRDLQQSPPVPVDHATIAWRLRLKVRRPADYRFVSNEFYRHLVRRAAFRACDATGFPDIAVRTVRLASDSFGYRDRSEGTDYVEFGLTRRPEDGQLTDFLLRAAVEMHPWLEWAGSHELLPATGKMPSKPLSLWELAIDAPEEDVTARLAWWGEQGEVPVILRSESFYAGESAEHGDAKEHVADMWLARDGSRVLLRMKLTGRLGPYQAAAALLGKASWIELARYPARRVEFFGGTGQACLSCGRAIPSSLLDVPFSEDHCPRCQDEAADLLIGGLARSGV